MKGVNVNVTIKGELKKELKKYAKQVCVGAASYVRDELTNAAYDAFERFYCDYTPVPGGLYTSYQFKFHRPDGNPKVYDRTYNVLRNGIEKYYEDKGGNIVRGGTMINPENFEDNYDYSPTSVFETIYERGWHGPTRIPNMSPTPKELIEESYNNLYNNIDVAVDVGITRACKGNYTYLG